MKLKWTHKQNRTKLSTLSISPFFYLFLGSFLGSHPNSIKIPGQSFVVSSFMSKPEKYTKPQQNCFLQWPLSWFLIISSNTVPQDFLPHLRRYPLYPVASSIIFNSYDLLSPLKPRSMGFIVLSHKYQSAWGKLNCPSIFGYGHLQCILLSSPW